MRAARKAIIAVVAVAWSLLRSRHMRSAKPKSARPGSVRVIGGELRGRRLPIPDHVALRPTPDRVRETVFNWLEPYIDHASCLDLFAGTGVLGIEALSRGAAAACFVEADAEIAAALRERLRMLALHERGEVHTNPAEIFLAESAPRRFDIVFLDPPYAVPLAPLVEALRGRLSASGLIYVERPAAVGLPASGSGCVLTKSARAGRLSFGLLRAAEAE
jgi:16S rRNA (guanine966-N2)-methyltransferase